MTHESQNEEKREKCGFIVKYTPLLAWCSNFLLNASTHSWRPVFSPCNLPELSALLDELPTAEPQGL